jgi:alpha-beta hydrolase superfamily lysophospholipase
MLVTGCGGDDAPERAVPAESRPVEFPTSDGWLITGDLYLPDDKGAGKNGKRSALLLLHMLDRDASSWEPLAAEAVSRGIAVLAIDLRGHGGSRPAQSEAPPVGAVPTSGERPSAESFRPGDDFKAMLKDVEAAYDYLYRKHSVPRHQVVLAGASLGGSLALLFAADRQAVPGVAVLSPVIVWKGLVVAGSVRAYGARPLLLVSSAEDEYSVRSGDELARRGVGAEVSIRIYEGGARGTDMFVAHPGKVEREVVGFASEVLGLPLDR